MGSWKCLKCDRKFESETPPDRCPACDEENEVFLYLKDENIANKNETSTEISFEKSVTVSILRVTGLIFAVFGAIFFARVIFSYSILDLCAYTIFFMIAIITFGLSCSVMKNKVRTIVIGCSIVCVSVIVFSILGYINREKTVEENLLGKWVAENSDGESTIVFSQDENNLLGLWTVYDYMEYEWIETSFKIKEINKYSMEILTGDGEIRFIPFSVSKDTLFFDNVEYVNHDKNIKIPPNTITYISDNKIRPVTEGLFLGMTKDEVENIIYPNLLSEDIGHDYFYEIQDVDLDNDIRCTFEFGSIGFQDDELAAVTYKGFSSEEKNFLLEYCCDHYGEYEKEEWTSLENHYYYTWKSGNLVVRMTEFDDRDLWLTYCLDDSWVTSNMAR